MKPLDNRASDDDNHLETKEGNLIKFHTPAFLKWLENNHSFRFEAGEAGYDSYRARKENIKGVDYWYAVKKVNGKLHKRFIGKSEELTHTRLVEVSKLIRQPPQKQNPVTKQVEVEKKEAVDDGLSERVTALESLVNRLQHQLEELPKKLDDSDEPVVSSELEALREENKQLKSDNRRLTNQVERLTNQMDGLGNQDNNTIVNSVMQPDYLTIRNRVVSGWKVAKRAETKERIALAIDKFIEEVKGSG